MHTNTISWNIYVPLPTIFFFLLPHTGMASAEVYAAAIAHFTKHRGTKGMSLREIVRMFPGVTMTALSDRINGRVLMDAKAGPSCRPPPQGDHRASSRTTRRCANRHARQRREHCRSCSQARVICFFESASV